MQEFHLNDGNRARITKTYFYRADARLTNGRKQNPVFEVSLPAEAFQIQ